MKEKFGKVWPILLPVVCFLCGVLSFLLFFLVDKFKGHYDIIAIGAILIALSIFAMILGLVNKKKDKE